MPPIIKIQNMKTTSSNFKCCPLILHLITSSNYPFKTKVMINKINLSISKHKTSSKQLQQLSYNIKINLNKQNPNYFQKKTQHGCHHPYTQQHHNQPRNLFFRHNLRHEIPNPVSLRHLHYSSNPLPQ